METAMDHDNKCIHFRDLFHEFLVEPTSAPKELLADWMIHEAECQECQQLFRQMKNEQDYVERLVCAVFAQPVRPQKKNSSAGQKVPWRGLGWCLAVFTMIVVSFYMGFVQHQPHINKEIKKRARKRHEQYYNDRKKRG